MRTNLSIAGLLCAGALTLVLQVERSQAEERSAARVPEVLTDQQDYLAGTMAAILGSGFGPNETVRLQVVRADGTPSPGSAHSPWSVRANANGDFLTEWRVCADDCAGSYVELSAVGQASGSTATVRFFDRRATAGESTGAEAPTNQNASQPIKLSKTAPQFQGWLNLLQQWGGTVQGSNSKYGDGDMLPLRLTASLAPGSTHTLVLKYDFSTGGSQRFFDSLGSFNTTVPIAALLAGIASPGSPSQWNIPVDGSLPTGAQLPGLLIGYNISSLSFGGYTLVNGIKMLSVSFTVASGGTANKNIVIGYGAHLAAENAWGTGNGASQFPGASEKAYASLDGSSDMNVAVNPGTIQTSADLALLKFANPEPVYSGDTLTYQLAVRNNGPDTASAVVVQDALPAGTVLVSASASQGTWSGSSALSFSLGSIYPGNYATLTIMATVTKPVAGMITNTATVSSATADPYPTNNTASAISTVQIRDTTPPVISCPADIVCSTAPGQSSAVVFFTTTATDNVQVSSVTCTPPPGSTFPVGTNVVLCTATDTSGNTVPCSFRIVVRDTESPQITCPADLAVTNDPGQCSAVVKFSLATSDNCPGTVVGSTPPSGSAFPVGTNVVLCVATDAAGNTSTCSFTVAVLDREPPQLTCPAPFIAQADTGRCDAAVSFALPSATDNCAGPVSVVCNPASGSLFPIGTNFVLCTATDTAGNNNFCVFPVIVQDPGNQSWPQALSLNLVNNAGLLQADVQQCLSTLDQSRWFRFKVQPGSRVIVTLTDLPENYDLVLFKDIATAFSQLNSSDDLVHLTAQFANDGFSPSAFSPSAFSPSAFSPSAFSPSAFSPSAFSPSAFSPSAFSPSAFSPSAFSPDAFAPSAFSPSAFSPSAFSPSAFSPSAFSPSAFSPSAFSAAQVQSVLAVSAFDGIASEGVLANTWNEDGDFYVRVRGRNGVFSPGNPFHLSIYMLTGACGDVSPIALDSTGQPLAPSTTAAPTGGYETVILCDLNRWLGAGPSAAKANVLNKLSQLAGRPEVKGVVVDVGADPAVAFFNAQADQHFDCPFAKNLVAGAIRDIINRSRAGNALQYVVIVGDDSVIPFFRYPDEALLGPERNYVPPVKDLTASQASLRFDYVLSQDAYGAQCSFSLKTTELPLPDLAVGRLVETPDQVDGLVDAYLATSDGVVPTPASALATGYDFLADDAQAVANEFALGLGTAPDTLISPNTLAPSLCWTADDLRQALFSKRHALIFLAGHFSAAETLAADYSTHVLASELADSATDFRNTILFSAGCHFGYNVVNADSIPFVTLEPDWVQALASKQATVIAGTGYQYGDTDFIEYSERVYLEFAKQLRTGSGAVAVGRALLNAKSIYLAATPQMRGIHTKTYLETTLFGLPMLSVNMPGTRRAADVLPPAVSASHAITSNPGALLGLSSADLSVTPALVPTHVTLNNTEDGTQTVATYLAGGDGLINNPAEPILPLIVRNITLPGTVLRGLGFRGGTYTDLNNQVPLTGAATTEIRGVHAAFLSEVFYPMRPWSVNYFGALCGGLDGTTRLMAVPAQFKSDSPTVATGTLRQFSQMDFRLFYDANIATYTDAEGNTSTPALSGPPSISGVLGLTSAGGASVALSARIVGNPAAGIQAAWVTFTANNGPYAGRWQSLDLTQSSVDSTLWQGTLPLNGTASQDIRYIVQAVSGVGLVALDTKLGAYHIPDEFDSGSTAQLAPTRVNLLALPATGAFGTTADFQARLTSADGLALSHQRIVFRLGDQELWATSDSSGLASALLPLRSLPGDYEVKASFPGSVGLAPSFDAAPFTIMRQGTTLTVTPTLVYVKTNANTGIVATLMDAAGNNIIESTVLFVTTGANGAYATPVITDASGHAPLGALPLAAGSYNVAAYFDGIIPLPNQTLTIDDGTYFPSTTAGVLNLTLVLDDRPPQILCPANIIQATDPGRCDAVVNYSPTATDDNPGVQLVCTPPSGSVFPKGSNTVNCVAMDAAGNVSSCAFTVTVLDAEKPAITCPPDIHVGTDLNMPSAIVHFMVTATDNCPGVAVVSTPISGSTFPHGVTTVNSTATDTSGNTSFCSFNVVVGDTQPPVIKSVIAAPNVLSPPNHQMVLVTVTVSASDNSGGPVTSAIIAVRSSDPTNTTGDGNTGGDWLITGPSTVYLRAERSQSGVGRTYTITVRSTDPSGNAAQGTVTVFVPPSSS